MVWRMSLWCGACPCGVAHVPVVHNQFEWQTGSFDQTCDILTQKSDVGPTVIIFTALRGDERRYDMHHEMLTQHVLA